MDIKQINYLDYGCNKKGTIVLLHGWGQNIEMMDMLGRPFEKEYRIIVLDLPGFGKTPEPQESATISDYAKWVWELLTSLKVKNPILVGHSFGGRISICYAALYKTEKVVLLSSPFRPSTKKKHNWKVKLFKFVKKFPFLKSLSEYLKEKWGSVDYKNASDINRGTLIKVVNDDLTRYAEVIKCPVLLIYGQDDKDVLISEAKELEKIIPDAGLVVYENAHHYAYLECLNQTIAILKTFFE
ncbi:MAG: alpha/beta hydrolase [Firmicutes bacterium]|nr:alpha/beta hydrolase [Bacillota bacterium]